MRSDWDNNHKKPRDQQKRYPTITESEWHLLLKWAKSYHETTVTKLPQGTEAEQRAALQLVRKIEARLEKEK